MIEIKFCENNLKDEFIVDRLNKNFSNISISIEQCLDYCGICSEIPYALVGDELVKSDDPEALYDAIAEKIRA